MIRLLEFIKAYRGIIIFLSAFILFLITLSIIISNRLVQSAKEEAYKNLRTLTNIKVNEIENWREERQSEAEFIQNSKSLTPLIYNFLKEPGKTNLKEQIFDWLKNFKNKPDYHNILICDTAGASYSLFLDNSKLSSNDLINLQESKYSGKILIEDIHKNDEQIQMDYFIPLRIPDRNEARIFGFIILQINPEAILFPLINMKAVFSKTAETFIVRRDDYNVTFLNELRYIDNLNRNYRLPLSSPNLPAAKAVLGYKGDFKGVDYSGNKVLTYLDKIPDSPWFIVTKINEDEVYTPFREQAFFILGGVLLLILLTGSILFVVLKNEKIKIINSKLLFEQKTKEQLKKLSSAVEQSNASIVITDINGNIEYVNPEFTRNTGYTIEEVIGKNPRILKSGVTEPSVYNQLWAYLSNGKTWTGELINKKKNGELYQEYVTITPIKNEEGITTHFVAVKEDITELKTAKMETERSHQQIKEIIERVNDSFWAVDNNFNIIFINKPALKFFNCKEDELLGKNLWISLPKLKNTFFEEMVKKAISSNEPVNFEIKGIYTDNHFFYNTVYPSTNGITFYVQDITEQKETRTKLMKALEEKEMLMKEVHHRVKNSLQIVSSILNLQLDSSHGESKRHLEDAVNRVKSIASLHSKLYVGDNFREVNLTEYLKDIVNSLRESYANQDLKISFNMADLTVDVHSATWIGIIVNELVSNSFKYAFTENKNGEICLELKKNNDSAYLILRDNGIGYPPDISSKTTLGFQLIFALAEQLNGKITMENKGGAYTILQFPIVKLE